MSLSQFFGGRVTHQSLPILELPLGADAPSLKRLKLPQGDLAQLHNSAEPIHFLAWLELKSGVIRGNHVHRVKKEFMYLLAGTVTLYLEDISSCEKVTLGMIIGDLIVIEPGIAHAIVPHTDGQALEYSPSQFDPEDTIRHSLVDPPSSAEL
ncbi:MAG TPA: WxcM-like domain-containing protein [Verrucomicrobiota bacterium]|nr:hypothetical protein [Verrucomicrobiales bacterium]HRI12551.1 WxcM-like domain-containing protein [Verrucomicrobiota bacterium]